MMKKVANRVTGGLRAKRKVEKLPPKPKAGAVRTGGLNQPKRPNKKVARGTVKGKSKARTVRSTAGRDAGNAGY